MTDVVKKLPENFKDDIKKAIDILKKYGCSEIFLFGSLANGNSNETSDIDIAVKGIKPELFFKAYSDLSFNIKRKIDLINIDSNKRFTDFLYEIKEIFRVA